VFLFFRTYNDVTKLETLADRRDWLGAPIYRRAKALFD
jgi:hypothetical protein